MSIAKGPIVCLGDSLTAFGTWVSALEAHTGVPAINAGVGGNTALQGLARFETDVAPHQPAVVILGFGTNDQVIYDPASGPQVSPAVFRTTMQELITRSKALGADVFVLTPCVVDSTLYYTRHPKEWCEPLGGVQAILESYRQILRELAAQTAVSLIDIGALSAHHKEDILGTPADPDFDGVHPCPNGWAYFDRWIVRAVTKEYINRA